MISKDKVEFIAFILFLYMIPISHLYSYHQLVGNFSLPHNIFNLISLFILLILFVYYAYNAIQHLNYSRKKAFLFYFLYTYMLFVSVINYYNYQIINVAETWKYFQFTYNVLLSFITYYLIGFYYKGYSKYYKYLLFFYILLTLNTWWNIDLNTLYISFLGVAKEKAGLYQYLGDTYAIFALLVIVLTKNNFLKLILIIFSFVSLFILMSRSSLYVFIIVILIYLVVKHKKVSVIYLMIFFIFISLFTVYGGEYFDIIMNSRLMSFTKNSIDKDGSVAERIILAKVGFDAIKNYWIIGDYGGDVIYFLRQGKYIHNFFSVLRQFGIIAFVIYLYFILQLLLKSYFWIKKSASFSKDYDYFIVISLFFVLEVLVARAWTHAYIFFSIGVLVNLSFSRNWQWSNNIINKIRKRT